MMNEPTSTKIEYEHNVVEYMLKPSETINKTHLLLHPDLYSTCNYWSPHGLILGESIKTHLGNLGGAALDHLNYLGLVMCLHYSW
jgi:hypothetical protein